MLYSKSTKGCRLSPTGKLTIPAIGHAGVTSGYVNPACGLGRAQRTAAKPPLTKSQKRRATKRNARIVTGR